MAEPTEEEVAHSSTALDPVAEETVWLKISTALRDAEEKVIAGSGNREGISVY